MSALVPQHLWVPLHSHHQTFWGNAGATVKLNQGPDGNLYQLTIYPGELSVISPSGGNRAPTAVIGATPTNTADKTLEVDFTATNSTDPDGDDLTYLRNFRDGTTSTEMDPTRTFTTAGVSAPTPSR
jgi:PKD domain